jgi:hypothetical protein
MRFDANRLSVLAGLSNDKSGLLREGVPDGVMGDEQYTMEGEPDEEGYDENLGLFEEEEEEGEEGAVDPDAKPDPEIVDALKAAADDEGFGLDEYVTVDENVLRREIMRMKKQQLSENSIRMAIRKEIESILSEDTEDEDLYLTSSWLYGSNKPRNSRKGSVHTVIPGLGFKAQ